MAFRVRDVDEDVRFRERHLFEFGYFLELVFVVFVAFDFRYFAVDIIFSLFICFTFNCIIFLFASVLEHRIFCDLAFFFNFENPVVVRGDIVDPLLRLALGASLLECLIQRVRASAPKFLCTVLFSLF